MVYKTLNFSEVWQSYDNFIYDNFMKVELNTNDFNSVQESSQRYIYTTCHCT